MELYILEGCVSLYGLTGGSAGESESGVGFHFGVGGELVALVVLGQFLFCIWHGEEFGRME